MQKRAQKVLLVTFIIFAVLSIAATFYRTMVIGDFYIENDLEEEYENESV